MSKQRSAEREEFYGDVLTIALEGGIGYWSLADHITRDEDLTVLGVTLYVTEGCHVCGEEDRPATAEEISAWENGEGDDRFYPGDYFTGPLFLGCHGHRVTRDTIGTAFTRIGDRKRHQEIGLHPSYRATYVAASFDPEEADLDAGDADNIVQVGLFGEVVFG